MNILTFTLKQHTPLIHFQHDQHGATLRASEVKPMLDRYLIHSIGGWDKIPKVWKIDNPNTNALKYKIIILQVKNIYSSEIQPLVFDSTGGIKRKNNGKFETKQYPGYFGNTGKEFENELKWFRWSENFQVRFFINEKSLSDYVNIYFPEFIFYTNFGTRSGKGFGSYSVIDNDKKAILPTILPKFNFKIAVNDSGFEQQLKERYKTHYSYLNLDDNQFKYLIEIKELFTYIDLLYNALRSGINRPNQRIQPNPCINDSRFYLKSFLFSYFQSKGIQWDKKTIKEYFYYSNNSNDCLPKQKEVNTDVNSPLNFTDSLERDKKLLIRDLLGLSLLQDWQSYQNDKISKESIDRLNNEPKYSRFKSPIIFKPIRNLENNDGEANIYTVYIIPVKFPNELKGKKFIITSKNMHMKDSLILTYPKEFDVSDFLEYVFEKKNDKNSYAIDLKDYIEKNKSFENQWEFDKLTKMFNEIRNIPHE